MGSRCVPALPPTQPPTPQGVDQGEAGRQAASSRSNSLLRDAKVRAPHPPQTRVSSSNNRGPQPPEGQGATTPGVAGPQKWRKNSPPQRHSSPVRMKVHPPRTSGWGGPLNPPEHMPKCYCPMGLSLPSEGITWFASSGPDIQARVSAHLGRNTTAIICLLPAHVVLKSGCETVEDTQLTPFCRATGEPGDRSRGGAFTLNPKSRASTDADSMRQEGESGRLEVLYSLDVDFGRPGY